MGSGDVCLSRSAARGVDHAEVTRSLSEAIAGGLGLVEVSDEKDTERLVGEVVRTERARDRVVVSTRVGGAPPGVIALARGMQARVEASLKATRQDALGLALLPVRIAWLGESAWSELVGTAARLVREGKVRRWGLTLDATDLGSSEPVTATATSPSPPPLPSPALPRPSITGWVDPAKVLAAQLEAATAAVVSASAKPGSLLLSLDDAFVPPDLIAPSSPPGATADSDDSPAPSIDLLARLASQPWLSGLHVELSLCARAALPALVHLATSAPHLAILAARPLAGGALAGNLGVGVTLRPRDDRGAALTPTALERISVGLAELAAFTRDTPQGARSCDAGLARLAQRPRVEPLEARTVAELALRFAIDAIPAAIALPRLHRRDLLGPAVACAGAPPLSRDLLDRLEKIAL